MKEAIAEWDVLAILPIRSSPDILSFLAQVGVKYELIDAEVDMDDAPTIARKLQRTGRRIRSEIKTFRRLLRIDLSSAILHIESAPWQSWLLYAAFCSRRANVFVTMHNALPNRPRWRVAIWKARLRFLSRLRGFHLFTSNHDTRNKLKGWVDEGFWKEMKVTYTCVDPIQIKQALALPFDKAARRGEFGISAGKCVVLCVAQFIDRKGRWVFLDAAKEIAKSSSNIDFVWVTPELPDEFESEKIFRYGLGDRFRLVQSRSIGVRRLDILQFFLIGDMFVLPSFLEGLPISLLEAMALGLPVISTNVNAIPEAVKNNETGVLVPPYNPIELAREITALAKDPVKRTRLAAAGQDFVLSNFDERIASRIALKAYKESLEAQHRTK